MGRKDPATCSLRGSPELTASGADPGGHTHRREVVATRVSLGSWAPQLKSESLHQTHAVQRTPCAPGGLSSWLTHLLLQGASGRADHRVFLHTAGQKAHRVPQIEWEARRTEDTPKVGCSRTAMTSWSVTLREAERGRGYMGSNTGDRPLGVQAPGLSTHQGSSGHLSEDL